MLEKAQFKLSALHALDMGKIDKVVEQALGGSLPSTCTVLLGAAGFSPAL